ncbi:hypothetical protein R80B4_02439 [Fibrobacteres bacterium R8-0-B4]
MTGAAPSVTAALGDGSVCGPASPKNPSPMLIVGSQSVCNAALPCGPTSCSQIITESLAGITVTESTFNVVPLYLTLIWLSLGPTPFFPGEKLVGSRNFISIRSKAPQPS